MSHYELYPYPDPNSHLSRAPLRQWRTDNGPRRGTWDTWFPGQPYGRKRVLVVGCGTTEATIIAAQEPALDVTGIDASANAIWVAEELARAESVGNVDFHAADFRDCDCGTREPFDAVICCGVLHHIREPAAFVAKLRSSCVLGGKTVAMVYGDVVRSFVPAFSDALRTLGAKPDEEGVALARRVIEVLPAYHPARALHDATDGSDAQIADLWLHPYFRQYRADELLRLFEGAGFAFNRWMAEDPVSMKLLASACNPERVSRDERLRVAQVLNFADLKLTAMFSAC